MNFIGKFYNIDKLGQFLGIALGIILALLAVFVTAFD